MNGMQYETDWKWEKLDPPGKKPATRHKCELTSWQLSELPRSPYIWNSPHHSTATCDMLLSRITRQKALNSARIRIKSWWPYAVHLCPITQRNGVTWCHDATWICHANSLLRQTHIRNYRFSRNRLLGFVTLKARADIILCLLIS